jgi:threonine aldolase
MHWRTIFSGSRTIMPMRDNSQRGLQQIPGISIDPDTVDTNILFFDVVDAQWSAKEFVAALKPHGLLLNAVGARSCRAVTHLDVPAEAIEQAAGKIARVLDR